MTTPSFELGQDHLDLRAWVHDFAAEVIRPAAAEWDEREEFPWPVVEEAAKVGLYSLDFVATQAVEPTGLGFPIAMEELFWGDAGIGLSIVGTSLAAAGVRANGTDEQVMEWVPQMYGSPGDLKLGAFCSSEPDAGSDVGAMRTRATYDEATDEWVLNGTKTWATNGGIADVHVVTAVVDPELRSRGQASFVVPPGTKGLSQGQKFHKHGIRASHTAEVVLDQCRVPGRCLLGGKEKLDQRLAKAREGGTVRRAAVDVAPSSAPVRRSGPRRSASPGRRTRWRWTTPRRASSSASRSSRTRASRSCSPTWRPRSRRPGCWCGGPRGWRGRASGSRRPRARCPSCSPARPRSG